MIARFLLDSLGLQSSGLAALPEQPPRPHDFDELEGLDLDLQPPAQPALRIHLRVTGQGPPLLLVHGLMTSAWSFRYVATALGRDFRVYIPDLPGAGRTLAPAETDMGPGALAATLAALIAALGLQRPVVVGNSMGGYLCARLALDHPDQVGRLLILHAPAPVGPRLALLHVATSLPLAEALLRSLVTRDPEEFVRRNVHYRDPGIMSRQETREYGRIFRDEVQTGLFFKVLRDTMAPEGFDQLARGLRAAGGLRRAGAAPMPVGLIWSTQDVMVPPQSAAWYQALLPDAPLTWLSDTSHFLHVDSPEAAIAAIRAFGLDQGPCASST